MLLEQVAAFQRLLRETNLGKAFFGSIAQPRTVRNVLREAYGIKDAVTDELVDKVGTCGGVERRGGGMLESTGQDFSPLVLLRMANTQHFYHHHWMGHYICPCNSFHIPPWLPVHTHSIM